jgi:16S rRNA (guanine527-N7)-methyltransferase
MLKPPAAGFQPLIHAVARGLGTAVGADVARRMATWFDLIATWNAKIDLTAARTPEELADLMLADAFVLARHPPLGSSMVDVGAGCGAPGLALHLLRPDLAVTLVEPLQKRVAFLRTVSGQLALGPAAKSLLTIVRGRGEDIVREGRSFDGAVARATLAPEDWLALGSRLVGPTGGVWVLLAREKPPLAPGWQFDIDEHYQWPLTNVGRRLLRYGR